MHYCLIWSWLDWCGLATATVQALCFLTPDCIVHFQRVSRKMGLGLPTKPENRSSLNSSDACGTLAAIFDKATGSCGAVVNRAQHFSSLRSVTPSPVPVASKRRKLLHRQYGECFSLQWPVSVPQSSEVMHRAVASQFTAPFVSSRHHATSRNSAPL